MAVGRKGVFFTLMALLLVAFLFTYQSIINPPQTATHAETEAAAVRISLLNSYITTFEEHAADSLATSGYFTLRNLSGRTLATGAFISDMNASVNFCLNNNTNPYNCLNQNQTLNYSLNKLVDIAQSNLSIATTYKVNKIWVSEENPFEVIFWMNITYNVTDSFASWQVQRVVRAPVDVTGIDDPAYAHAYAIGEVTRARQFSLTQYKRFEFTNTTFLNYYNNRAYIIAVARGPSVLQRYAGSISSNSTCCGIESVIRYDELPASLQMPANPALMNWSFADYQFFMHSDPKYNFDCNTMAIWSLRQPDFPEKYVRLDTDHIWNVYQLNGSEVRGCNP